MPCGCGSGSSSGTEQWVNVKGDGTQSSAGSKAEAVASQQVNGGYLKKL
jgi:hypothetical protein